MRSSFPARSSKARATAVMASTPPRRSYSEPSTVPPPVLVSSTVRRRSPHRTSANRVIGVRHTLYLPLTDGSAARAARGVREQRMGLRALRTTLSARRKYAADASPDDPWDRRRHGRHKPAGSGRGFAPPPGGYIRQPDHRQKLPTPG